MGVLKNGTTSEFYFYFYTDATQFMTTRFRKGFGTRFGDVFTKPLSGSRKSISRLYSFHHVVSSRFFKRASFLGNARLGVCSCGRHDHVHETQVVKKAFQASLFWPQWWTSETWLSLGVNAAVVYFNRQTHACACICMVENNERHYKSAKNNFFTECDCNIK